MPSSAVEKSKDAASKPEKTPDGKKKTEKSKEEKKKTEKSKEEKKLDKSADRKADKSADKKKDAKKVQRKRRELASISEVDHMDPARDPRKLHGIGGTVRRPEKNQLLLTKKKEEKKPTEAKTSNVREKTSTAKAQRRVKSSRNTSGPSRNSSNISGSRASGQSSTTNAPPTEDIVSALDPNEGNFVIDMTALEKEIDAKIDKLSKKEKRKMKKKFGGQDAAIRKAIKAQLLKEKMKYKENQIRAAMLAGSLRIEEKRLRELSDETTDFWTICNDHMTQILPVFALVIVTFVLALTIANTGELAYKSLVHWRPTVYGKNTSRNMQMLRFANEWEKIS